MRRFTIGSGWRSSIRTKTPRMTSPPTKNATMWESSGRVASCVTAQSSPKIPAPSVSMPPMSKRWCREVASLWSTRVARATATMPIGTLIQKIHRHET